MKYYKLLTQTGWINSFKKDQIYPESDRLLNCIEIFPKDWQEVPELDYLIQEGKFPEKWCIKLNNQEVVDYCNKYGKVPPYKISLSSVYAHFPAFKHLGADCTTTSEIKEGYTKITFEQFKKYILNKNEMNKKIVGYKSPKNLYNNNIKIGDILKLKYGEETKWYITSPSKETFNLPKEIVEAWEPVYEEEKIEIKGYIAEFQENCVKFGCQSFSKDFILALDRLLQDHSFKMDYKDEIHKIANYFRNK